MEAPQVALVVKNPPASSGDKDTGGSPGSEDPLEKGMATHPCILAWRIPIDRGAWWATAHGVTESQTQLKRLNIAHHFQMGSKRPKCRNRE